ncbi:MAG: four helix bundle protein [Anaerolineae bacterium]|nr:four helix bundle protein [Candidatus Roseilinea sp.]MDW8450294.1 four helix bundle protein [Anaerolineae bacterium]
MDELQVLKQAAAIADDIWDAVTEFDAFARDTLGRQLVRACDSIGANIAESCGRFHFGDRLQFRYYARGSLYEAKYWLDRAHQRHIVSDSQAKQLVECLTALAKRLNALASGLKSTKRDYSSALSSLKEAQEAYVAKPCDLASPDDLFNATALQWLSTIGSTGLPAEFVPPDA